MTRRVLVSALAAAAFAAIPVLHAATQENGRSDRLACINHIAVVYEENHGFDLYGSWESVGWLLDAPVDAHTQVIQSGAFTIDDYIQPASLTSLVLTPFLRGDFADHTAHDTTSILATIERRFGLSPPSTREAAVRDLSSVHWAKSSNDDSVEVRGR